MILYEHQKKIIKEDKKKTGLFLGTGSSKTRIALELAQGNILVIVPKTQFEDKNWQKENQKWNINKFITVVSKETFRRDAHTYPRFDTVIIDEAHVCLGATPTIRYVKKQPVPKTSQIFDALYTFVNRTMPDRLYLVTATPIRSPFTVWAAGKLLGYDYDFYNWRYTFYTKLPIPGRDVWIPKKDEDTKNRLAKVVRGLGYVGQLSDYFDVPTQSFRTIYVENTAEQKQVIKDLTLDFPDPLVLVGKKHMAENGIVNGNEFEPIKYLKNAKIDKLLDLALEFPKMVVFARYTGQIEAISLAMKSEGYNVSTMTGDTKKRGEVITEAENSKECIFIVQAQISAGWEAPSFPVMVFASVDYQLVNRVQAIGRILRANSLKRNLYIDLIVKGGVDEAVFKAISNKVDFHERIYVKTRV